MFFTHFSTVKRFGLCLILSMLVACASTDVADKRDPIESYNRKVFAFNDSLDKYLLKPVAKVYDRHVPKPVANSVTNFFSNLGDVPGAVNGLLQAKPKKAGADAARFAINSTVGILGLFDVASKLDINSGDEDFGQTLERWGVKPGPYIVWPILGGRTVTDTTRLVVDNVLNPLQYVGDLNVDERLVIQGVGVLNSRASLLAAESVLSGDRYSLFREAYFLRREYLNNDGKVKDVFGESSFDDDIFDD